MQKKPPIRSKSHLEFIRSMPCVKCANPASQAAHLRIGSDGGTGLKPSDSYTLPLCAECHSTQHRTGERSFWKNIDAAHELANALWLFSGDVMNGLSIIARKRRELF